MASYRSRFAMIFGISCVVGCSTGGEFSDQVAVETPSQDAAVADAVSTSLGSTSTSTTTLPRSNASSASQSIAVAERIVAHDPLLASLLAPNAQGWQRSGDTITSPGFRGADARRLEGVGARLPEHADGFVEIALGRSALHTVSLLPTASRASKIDLIEGRATYLDAYPSTDVLWTAAPSRIELFLLLRDENAPREFSWKAKLGAGIARVEETLEGECRFVDEVGDPVLKIAKPFAIDTHGTRRNVAMKCRDGALSLQIQTEGLSYPVLIDPAFETGVWTSKALAPAPTARFSTSMAYDSTRAVSVLFGGGRQPGVIFCDTWEYNGSAWIERSAPSSCPAPPGATSPSRRQGHGLVYDSTRKVTVFFGGNGGGNHNDLWEWDGTNWAKRCSPCTPSPTVRFAHGMAFDSARSVTVLFGGADATRMCDTWEWNGTTWTLRSVCGPGVPSARSSMAMAYDASRARTVLFGGTDGLVNFGDTWEWNGAAGTWSLRAATSAVGSRHSGALSYDSVRKKSVLVGGTSSSTWEWDGSSWASMGTSVPIASGNGPGVAFDSSRKRTVSFGGSDGPGTSTAEYYAHGGACISAASCDTAYCVDGVCCDTACGTCQRCDAGGVVGICNKVTNAEDDTCTGTNYCDATGACLTKGALGATCTPAALGTDCTSKNCVDGVCCNTACTALCMACSAAKTGGTSGTCANVATETDPDAECGAKWCSVGACVDRHPNGSACVSGTECASGNCVDSVCCDKACTGDCEACSAAKKGSGADGTCAFVAADTNPRAKCVVDPGYPTTCLADGKCDGAGACRKYATKGAACGATTCTAGVVSGKICNGGSTCDTSTTPCDPYVCGATTCKTTCATDDDCASGSYCTSTFACAPKKKAGGACASAKECATTYCADGVCCGAPCTGQCESCAEPGSEGSCIPVTGAPRGSVRPKCAGDPAVCGGTCDGSSAASCKLAPSTKSCGGACADGKATKSTCDGLGACVAGTPIACSPYTCADATQCRDKCTTDAECAAGYACPAGACTPKGTKCSLDRKASVDSAGTATPCSPILCDGPSGICGSSCKSDADCITDTTCNSSGQCVNAAPTTPSGGCGCAVPGGSSDDGGRSYGGVALLGLALAAYAVRARHR